MIYQITHWRFAPSKPHPKATPLEYVNGEPQGWQIEIDSFEELNQMAKEFDLMLWEREGNLQLFVDRFAQR